MRFFRLQQVENSEIGDSHSSTMSYTAYYLMILRRQLPSEENLLDSTTMRLHGHYIADRMMEFCSAAYHTRKHMKHLGKFTMACAELANWTQAWGPISKAWLLLAEDDFIDHRLY